MSKKKLSISAILAVTIEILQFFTITPAQDVRITVKLADDGRPVAEIRGKFPMAEPPDARREIWFLDAIAGVEGLSRRRSLVTVFGTGENIIADRQFVGPERFSRQGIGGYKYSVDLAPLGNTSAAHVSWANGNGGILMLDDLLPQSAGRSSVIELTLPAGWRAFAAESETAPGVYSVANAEKAVIYIGAGIRDRQIQAGHRTINVTLSGEWLFADADAAGMTAAIFDAYGRQFGRLTNEPRRIFIGKFPAQSRIGAWEAETRGRSVTILSADMPFKAQSVQRLHEQLRHEIFHLWVPNGVNLSGNYDWFYEGFAQYASLKLGVAVNQIRFDDMLTTLGQAYNIEQVQPDRRSLIEASELRFSGGNSMVYAKGMLVAFLCDIATLKATKGRSSVESLLREIVAKHPLDGPRTDGNAAVLAVMRGRRELGPIVDRYISGSERLDWQPFLADAGIEATGAAPLTKLAVKPDLNGRQKAILDKLGYNNWRKLSANLK
ncbi:MAG: hypothetical protein K1X36_10115 [Pyrinomonadaceae bacterium]|nr:hypothetical protein [Pyrinomonadaceae bacterium]